jgi:hypothetical protein
MADDSSQGKENYIDDYGEEQTNKHENANKAKFRGYPKESKSKGDDGENWNKGYDPNMWCRQWPDGSWERVCYGKNPSFSKRHSTGQHEETLQDGTRYAFNPGPKFTVNKSDVVETNNGSVDSKTANVQRNNAGHMASRGGGGIYNDAGPGGSASGSGEGGSVTYSDGNQTHLSAGKMNVIGSEELTMGSGNQGGQHGQYLTFKKDGTVVMGSQGRQGGGGGQGVGAGSGGGGGGDVIIRADKGDLKFVAGSGSKKASITLGADGSMTLNADGEHLSFSAKQEMRFAPDVKYKWAVKPGAPAPGMPSPITKYAEEKGYHTGKYNMYHGGTGTEVA